MLIFCYVQMERFMQDGQMILNVDCVRIIRETEQGIRVAGGQCTSCMQKNLPEEKMHKNENVNSKNFGVMRDFLLFTADNQMNR